MKLAIVAEGEHELGSREPAAHQEGVAHVFVRRLLEASARDPIELIPMKLAGQIRRRTGVRRGERETAELAVMEANDLRCDGVVLFRDADRDAEVRRTANLEGLASAHRGERPFVAVLALQVQMLEAWLLADAGAFARAFGRPRGPLPRPPEQLWGDVRDDSSNHPKQVFRRVMKAQGVKASRAALATLAQHADLDVLARECPEGFGRFRTDFQRAFRPFACVVAADSGNGIGKDNDMPWPRLKADLKHFRELTSSAPVGKRNAVIMGRKTWESMPAKYRPLPDRLNVVITRGTVEVPDGVVVARSLDDALNRACLAADVDRLYVVGGGEIYRHAFAHVRCRDVYMTRIEQIFECDTFIPELHERFSIVEPLGAHEDAGFPYAIQRLSRPPHA